MSNQHEENALGGFEPEQEAKHSLYDENMGGTVADAVTCAVSGGLDTTTPNQTSTVGDVRKEFEAWYYDQWSHGETTHVHHAHKNGCWMAWQAALASQPTLSGHDKWILEQYKHKAKLGDVMIVNESDYLQATMNALSQPKVTELELEELVEPHIVDAVYCDQGDIAGTWDAAKSVARAILARFPWIKGV